MFEHVVKACSCQRVDAVDHFAHATQIYYHATALTPPDVQLNSMYDIESICYMGGATNQECVDESKVRVSHSTSLSLSMDALLERLCPPSCSCDVHDIGCENEHEKLFADLFKVVDGGGLELLRIIAKQLHP